MARSLQLQTQRKPLKTVKRVSAASGQRKAIAVVEIAVLGKLHTLQKIAVLESLVDHRDSVTTLLVPERIPRAGQTLLRARNQNLQRNSQLEVPLRLEGKVPSSATSYEKADARMETRAPFGTHLFAEMRPLLQDAL